MQNLTASDSHAGREAPVAAVTIASPAAAASAGARTINILARRPGFLDLPTETQEEILSHCSQAELICLSLVSRYLRELAAAHLYRNFHIVFPDDDDPAFDSPIDSLAGGLDTFVTSDYNYAQHLKDISLDTLSVGGRAEKAYKPYLFGASCGKFMNTLLLLTLRRARALETFRWNIRVELSRPVYNALHQISSLKHLHIRLQAGQSLYEPLSPLPSTTQSPALPSTPLQTIPGPSTPAGPAAIPAPSSTSWDSANGQPPLFFVVSSYNPSSTPSHPPVNNVGKGSKPGGPKADALGPEPPTLSAFKDLRSLAVLDIGDLESLQEVATCIRNSSSTLKKLQLSFSDSLANMARKPQPETESDDSEGEEEFQVVDVPANPPFDSSAPAKAFRAQEERKKQDTALATIFGLESHLSGKKGTVSTKEESMQDTEKIGKGADEKQDSNDGEYLKLAARFGDIAKQLSDYGSLDELLRSIEATTKDFLASRPEKTLGRLSLTADPSEASAAGSSSASEATILAATPEVVPISLDGDEPSGSFRLIPNTTSALGLISTDRDPSDDFDMGISDAGDVDDGSIPEQDDSKPAETEVHMETVPSRDPESVTDPGPATTANQSQPSSPQCDSEMSDATSTWRISSTALPVTSMTQTPEAVERTEVAEPTRQADTSENVMTASQLAHLEDEMGSYVFSTRGLALKSLSIHLIPVRASVLLRAVDLHVLERLTLLNVGNQVPIWNLLRRENTITPLPLRKLFTDHVSTAFLGFVSGLREVEELFLLERSTKYKPESLAPRSDTTIEQIRRVVLRKHIGTLRRLMIRDGSSSNSNWDVDEKTIFFICSRGVRLEELAISIGIRAIHVFMQHMTNLVKLRAFHIIHFRNTDTCVWVIHETLRFIVDSLTHNSHLKLEWITVDDDRVVQIVRQSDEEREQASKASKAKTRGKGKETAYSQSTTPVSPTPVSIFGPFGSSQTAASHPAPHPTSAGPTDHWSQESGSDDEMDDDMNLKYKTVSGIHFCDVWGVRIFKKEIRFGRL